jgi:hypothetical protein
VPGGVEGRLLAGVDQGPGGVVEGGVADHDDVHGHVVAPLDPRGDRLHGRAQAALGRHRDPVQPSPQLPLLAAGQAHDLGGGVGPLDQGQGVQDRVVQVGGHLGPGLGADPAPALLGQLVDQPGRPGAEDEAEPDQGDGHPEQDVPGRGQVGAGVGEAEAEAGGDQQAPDQDPDEPDPAGEQGLDGVAGQPAGPLAVVAAGPDDGRAGRGQGDRPDDLVAEPQAELPQQEQGAEDDHAEGQGLAGPGPPDRPPPDALGVRLDRERPGQQVQDQPGAAGDGQHGEGDPDQDRVDAEPLAEPTGHTEQDPVGPAADDGRRGGRPLGDLGGRWARLRRVRAGAPGHGGMGR